MNTAQIVQLVLICLLVLVSLIVIVPLLRENVLRSKADTTTVVLPSRPSVPEEAHFVFIRRPKPPSPSPFVPKPQPFAPPLPVRPPRVRPTIRARLLSNKIFLGFVGLLILIIGIAVFVSSGRSSSRARSKEKYRKTTFTFDDQMDLSDTEDTDDVPQYV